MSWSAWRFGARSSSARRPQVTAEVNVDNESASNDTVVEVITRDRPGLSFVLSHALQRLGRGRRGAARRAFGDGPGPVRARRLLGVSSQLNAS